MAVEVSEVQVRCSFTKMVAVEDLKPNPKNPNQHPQRQIKMLAEIIKRQGWRNPIVVSKRSGQIVKGHARLEAAKLIGLKAIPIDEQEYTSRAEEYADLVADNKIAELGESDLDMIKMLAIELGDDFDSTLFALGEDFDLNLEDESLPSDGLGELTNQFIVSVHCTDEDQMREIFEELKERGLECRMIT